MPRVPLYEQNVAQRPIFQQGVSVQASPNDFGAAIGGGLKSAAQGMSSLSDSIRQVQDLEDAMRAKEADNNYAAWLRERMYGQGGFMTLEGKAAVDARSDFEKQAEEQRLAFGADLKGGAASKYQAASQSRVTSAFEQGIVHTANARKQWFKDSSSARLDTFSEDAIAAYQSPKRVDVNLSAGIAEIRQQAQMLGWDADTTRNREAEYVSTVRMGIVSRLLNDDPLKAKSYFDEHKSEFTGPHQAKIDEALKVPIMNERVKQYTDTFLQQRATAAVPAGDAAGVIRGFEGFKTTPYWDVNAYRVGYGSDTITKADGTVVKVTQDMTITREDAERDLARRINTEFVPGIVKTVGVDAWAKLPNSARAALASVAYNYGSLPRNVADAVRGGDIGAIATAVEGLSGHNDGINANRRAQEAAMIRGMNSVPASSAATSPQFTDIETYLSTISDPTERDMTRKAINANIDAAQKAQKAQREAYMAQAFNLIETQNISPFKLPAEVTTAIGMEGMSSLMTYWEKRSSGEKVSTDATVLYDLQTKYATDPNEFSKLNLLDYKNVLSDADFKAVSGWRQTALTDQRKAKEDGLALTSAFSQASDQLAAVGITTVGKDGSKRDDAAKRIAAFQTALASQMEEFKRLNDGRNPNQLEIQQMTNRLLLPIVIKDPNAWNAWSIFGDGGTSKDGKFLFEAGSRSDTETVDVAVKYEDIPVDLRRGIANQLERDLGRKPSSEEVVSEYERFILNR